MGYFLFSGEDTFSVSIIGEIDRQFPVNLGSLQLLITSSHFCFPFSQIFSTPPLPSAQIQPPIPPAQFTEPCSQRDVICFLCGSPGQSFWLARLISALHLSVSSGSPQSKHSGGWETECGFPPKGQCLSLQVPPIISCRPLMFRKSVLLRAGGFNSP